MRRFTYGMAATIALIVALLVAPTSASARSPDKRRSREDLQLLVGIGGGAMVDPTADEISQIFSVLGAVRALLDRQVALGFGLTYRSPPVDVDDRGLEMGELFVDVVYLPRVRNFAPYAFFGGGATLSATADPDLSLITASARVGGGFDLYTDRTGGGGLFLNCGSWPYTIDLDVTYTLTPGIFERDGSLGLTHSLVAHLVFKLLVS